MVASGAGKIREKEMKEQVLISVIVPVYAAEKYLERCVKSLTGQTWKNLEILLIDDGAKDRSPQMCDEFAEKDKRIRVIHKENGGLMSAWMRGVKESTGEYLCFVDSDDWIDLDMIEKMQQQTAGVKGEVVCCNFVISRPDGESRQCHGLAPGVYEKEALEEKVKPHLLGNENRSVCLSRCMKLISRELVEQNMKFCDPALRMGEDVNIMLPALLDARRIVIMKDSWFYHYFYNEESMVHKYDEGMYENVLHLNRVIFDILEEKKARDKKMQAEKESIFLFMLVIKNELRGGGSQAPSKVRQLCLDNRTGEKIRKYNITASDKANRLILSVMKKPSMGKIALLQTVLRIYDRMRG